MRWIVPRRKPDDAVIDGFTCSHCRWSFNLRDPRPFELPENEAKQACREFDRHVCADYGTQSMAAVA